MLRRSLALNFIEEREIGARYVFHLLCKRAHSLELTRGGNEVVLGLRHRLRHAQELPFSPMQRSAYALSDVLGTSLSCALVRRDSNNVLTQKMPTEIGTVISTRLVGGAINPACSSRTA